MSVHKTRWRVEAFLLLKNIVGWEEKRQKMQLKASLIIQVGLVTGWLGNGVAPDLHIQLAIII